MTMSTIKTREPLPPVQQYIIYMGCDPEFFFKTKTNRVVGAEKIIPEKGLGNVIIDGVQAELNPRPQTCRAYLANELKECFKKVKKELEKQGKGIRVSFEQSVKISKTELAKLDKKYQKLGCAPSLNTYENTGAKLKAVDPLTHRQRSAGGHIHLGHNGFPALKKVISDEPETLVKMLDIICGNTCVLVDRDKGNVERRKLYGYAGEYRLPKHGIEYRTLSNFWLRDYHLMSMAFGLARLAAQLCADTYNHNNKKYVEAFLGAVDIEKVRKAINTNDFKLAYENFKAIEPLLLEVCSEYGNSPLSKRVMPQFHYFVAMVNKHGLEYWFKDDPMEHWCNLPEAHFSGMHDFLMRAVNDDMNKAVDKAKVLKAITKKG